ncbi:MAG: glycosyltransferase family 2 protein, partial [Alphaproteobacteria bacterium]
MSDLKFLTFIFLCDDVLPQTIQSIQNQTDKDFNIFIISKETNRNNTICYFKNLNEAVKKAKTSYIYFALSDEIFDAKMISKLKKTLHLNTVDSLFFQANIADENGILYNLTKESTFNFASDDLINRPIDPVQRFTFDLLNIPALFKTTFLQKFQSHIYSKEYNSFCLQALLNANTVYLYPERLTLRRHISHKIKEPLKALQNHIHFYQFAETIIPQKLKADLQNRKLLDFYHIALNITSAERKAFTAKINEYFTKNHLNISSLTEEEKNIYKFLTEQRKNPLVSVISPVYNTADFLFDFFDSLQKQTLQDFEIICVDDASDDNKTLKVLHQWQKKDKRVHIYQTNHQGAAEARNTGFIHAKGKYVIFLDSDDFFHHDLLYSTFEQANRQDTDLTIFGYQRYDNEFKEIVDKPRCFLQENGIYNLLSAKKPMHILNITNFAKILKRTFIEENKLKYQTLTCCNDVSFTLLSYACAKRISNINQALIYYRYERPKSISSNRDRNLFDILSALDYTQERLKTKENWKDLKNLFVLFKWSIWVNHLAQRIDYAPVKYFYKELKRRLLNMPDEERQIVQKDKILFNKIKQIETMSYLKLKYFSSDFIAARFLPPPQTDTFYWKIKKSILFIL